MTNPSKNQSNHWTHSVSSYMLLRRKQVLPAYKNQLISTEELPIDTQVESESGGSSKKIGSNYLDALFVDNAGVLFQSFFVVLGQELEQGNTVIFLKVTKKNHEQPLATNVSVYNNWQLQILETLLTGWLSMIVDKAYREEDLKKPDSSISLVTQMLSKLPDINEFKSLLYINSVTRAEEQTLLSSLALAKKLAQFFLGFNDYIERNNISNEAQLILLFQHLQKLPLFVNQVQLSSNYQNKVQSHYNNQHKPIVISLNQCLNSNLNQSLISESINNSSIAVNSAPSNFNKNESATSIFLWLHRSWQAEQSIIHNIFRLNSGKPKELDVSNINIGSLKLEQKLAIDTVNKSAFGIITGGPGTGKTYTVAQLVIAINDANQRIRIENQKNIDKGSAVELQKLPLNIVLVAPTGKAAQRMQESLQAALDKANVAMTLQEAKTIHRLLGIGRTGIPRYTAENPLSEDVIIVDEASMLGVELADYLLSAVKTGARLILLGDAQQLSAVDAGAVLADLCQIPELSSVHANLTESSRFTAESAVGKLASFINISESLGSNQHDSNKNLNQLVTTKVESYLNMQLADNLTELFNEQQDLILTPLELQTTKYQNYEVYKQLIKAYEGYFKQSLVLRSYLLNYMEISGLELITKLSSLMNTFNDFRILTVSHTGKFGDERINEIMTSAHRQWLNLPPSQLDWYHGRPIMVKKNNYNLELFNGDIGLCIKLANSELAVYFDSKDQPIAVNRLGDLEVVTAYAMTVHKSQGSEFDHIAIMFDGSIDKLLSREMVYTAVTRAKSRISMFAQTSTLVTAINKPTLRLTGLGHVSNWDK